MYQTVWLEKDSRFYECKAFINTDEANKFIKGYGIPWEGVEWGVIAEIDKVVYVAKLQDKGVEMEIVIHGWLSD